VLLNKTYSYRVRATDAAGNTSRYSNVLKISTETETVTPTETPGETNIQTPTTGNNSFNIFTTALAKDMKSPIIQLLQLLLIIDGVYPGGEVTGYFGLQTELAVKRFQSKYGIITSGTPQTTGYGMVGPRTREKLNDTIRQILQAKPNTTKPSTVAVTTLSGSLKVGSKVTTTERLNVRSSANPTALLLGMKEKNSKGVIIDGPVSNGGHTWWKVTYDTGLSGWSVQTWLTTGVVTSSFPTVNTTTKPTVTKPTPTPVASKYTKATVAAHASDSSCWSIVDGSVYNLTNWISIHPGGAATIRMMCGIDGSNLYHGQHGTKASPANALKPYKLGALGS
jgi:peptidoglycan hydrolase-like protein with peptidoglycan-binding domain